jgi:NAD(P)-dependent dehydrogenase (short-subunit alcohol dehydrogenase family)
MTVLVTGASRGLGRGLVERALSDGHKVVAVSRHRSAFDSLAARFAENLSVVVEGLDNEASVRKIADHVLAKIGSLDLLINNAGVLKEGQTGDDLSSSFWLNSTVPFLLTTALLPALKKSTSPKVVQITSKMGSIDDNTSGGYGAYRASKAALNMLTRSLAIDYQDICFLLLHPGWVRTDMGGANAPLSIDESVSGMWKVICDHRLEKSGAFVDFMGRSIKW